MKIVQSFWSGNQTELTNNYGWYDYKYGWISWILSCHQLVKHHKEVELYTDSFGYEILIKKLQLPYTKVHVVLDDLYNYDKDLWAIAKIKTFQMQEEPFLHVDGDVFVWESLTDKFKNSNLVAQNLEITTDYYGNMWKDIFPNLNFLPLEMENYKNKTSQFACNMGIIGGFDINFFKDFTKKSIAFVDNNLDSWSKINGFNFNIFFEQVLFYELAKSKNRDVEFLFKEVSEDNKYVGFGDFHKVPRKTYLHLLGVFKRNASVCKAMEVYTMKYFPESYSKITSLINETEGNKNEIEFLTADIISELINQFDTEIKNNEFKSENFLIKRDLYTEGLSNYLEDLLINKLDFTIILLKCFEKKMNIINGEETFYLEIDEINSVSRIYDLDEIDSIILSELSTTPVRYFDFILKMNVFLGDEDDDSKNYFSTLLNNRLLSYINLKIICIYKNNFEKISPL